MQSETFCTDVIMRKAFTHLLSDLRTLLAWPEYNNGLEDLDLDALRLRNVPARSQASPLLFKAEYQIETFYKRYTFENDVFTDAELEASTMEKFMETQVRISAGFSMNPGLLRVLQKARSLCKEILASVKWEDQPYFSNFGRKAAYGVKAKHAYLDVKAMTLTGSSEQFSTYNTLVEPDVILRKIQGSTTPQSTAELKMSLVPKSWKAKRVIRPGTTAGTYVSSGLGGLIALALAKAGLDIRRLQKKHKRLAREGSINRRIATIDLSSASDSLTRELLHWILPRRWFKAVMSCVIRHVTLGENRAYVNSICLMGDGHTFPLQTLIFYCLVKALGELRGIDGIFSVYGDDIVCPTGLYSSVDAVFPRLHLNINRDKTYAKDFFRESCGGDYFHGYDVRPFQPEGQHRHLGKRDFLSFLYKLWNGFRLRWESDELPGVFNYLESQMTIVNGLIHQVPFSFPDTAGCHMERPSSDGRYYPVIRQFYGSAKRTVVHRERHRYHRPSYTITDGGNSYLNFVYLGEVSGKRDVLSQDPYYWNWLRLKESGCARDRALQSLGEKYFNPFDLISKTLWDDLLELPEYQQDSIEVLQWRRAKPRQGERQWCHGRNGQRLRRLIACVAEKNSTRYNETTGSISEWI